MQRLSIGGLAATLILSLGLAACETEDPQSSSPDVPAEVTTTPDAGDVAAPDILGDSDGIGDPDAGDGDPEDVGPETTDAIPPETSDGDATEEIADGGDAAEVQDDADAMEELPPPGCTSDADCDDADQCEVSSCDLETGDCVTEPLADDTPCDDGNLCSDGDHCAGGKCVGSTAADCDDGNPCTDDSCAPLAGCTHSNNFSVCDDGDPCTSGDHCVGGACTTTDVACVDGSICTEDICDPITGACSHPTLHGQPCDDGSACTLGDTCEEAVCVSGAVDGCDDDNPCTIDSCDDGVCDSQPANGEPCDDGDACTEGDACIGEVCASGGALDCDDKNVCTSATCDSSVGCVTEILAEASCSDEDACTDIDVCDETGACVPGAPLDCDDDNPCTDDTCDTIVGCKGIANNAECSDGDPCSLEDFCKNGVCKATSTDCFDDDLCTEDLCQEDGCAWTDLSDGCDDNNPCTLDMCHASSGCENNPNALPCDDDDVCTDDDTCADGACLGTPIDCSSGDPCIADSCDPTSGCDSEPIVGACDDGDACTSGTSCDDGGLCTGGEAVDYTDSVDCTVDACDPLEGVTHTPDHGQCLVGQFCDAVTGCMYGEIEVLISKVMVWPHEGESQWVQVTNYGENPVDLRALTLTDGVATGGTIEALTGPDDPVIVLAGEHAAGVHASQLGTAPADGISFVFGADGDGFSLSTDAPLLVLAQGTDVIDTLAMTPASTGPSIASTDYPIVQGAACELTLNVASNIKDEVSNDTGANWCAWEMGSTGPGGATLDCTRSRLNEISLGSLTDTRFVEIHMPVGAQTNLIKIRILDNNGQPVKLTKVGAGRVGTEGLPFVSSDSTSLAAQADGVVQLFYGSTLTDVYGFGTVNVAVDPFVGHPTYEGGPGPAMEVGKSAQRIVDGVDTDDNLTDWETSDTPSPGDYNAP